MADISADMLEILLYEEEVPLEQKNIQSKSPKKVNWTFATITTTIFKTSEVCQGCSLSFVWPLIGLQRSQQTVDISWQLSVQ